MGFGTLFIGYFLLLNLTYYSVTDVIAAAVMLLGLYKLSGVNAYFRYASIATGVFLAFSLGELGIFTYEMFLRPINSPLFISCVSMMRALIIGSLTVIMLRGIQEVSGEVSLSGVPERAKRLSIISSVTYLLWIVLELPISFINDYVLAVASLITLLLTMALIIANLTVIYTCYMKICMPGDEDVMKDKPSRFAFVNEYRAKKEERAKAEAEERLRLLSEKRKKKEGKK